MAAANFAARRASASLARHSLRSAREPLRLRRSAAYASEPLSPMSVESIEQGAATVLVCERAADRMHLATSLSSCCRSICARKARVGLVVKSRLLNSGS